MPPTSSLEEAEPFLENESEKSGHSSTAQCRRCARQYYGPTLPWILTTAVLSIVSVLLALRSLRVVIPQRASNTFETGFDTDLDVARSSIQTHKVRFTGGLLFHPNGTLYREHRPGDPHFFGFPSPEIDTAWAELLYSSGIDLEGAEAESVKNETFEEPLKNMWRTGLDVFHALHCVNLLRKSFEPDYYPPDDPPRLVRMHREHCMDYLRQQVMCQSDLSPVLLKWNSRVHYLIPQFTTQIHTCRDFRRIHEWSKQRAAERYFAINDGMIIDAVKAGEM